MRVLTEPCIDAACHLSPHCQKCGACKRPLPGAPLLLPLLFSLSLPAVQQAAGAAPQLDYPSTANTQSLPELALLCRRLSRSHSLQTHNPPCIVASFSKPASLNTNLPSRLYVSHLNGVSALPCMPVFPPAHLTSCLRSACPPLSIQHRVLPTPLMQPPPPRPPPLLLVPLPHKLRHLLLCQLLQALAHHCLLILLKLLHVCHLLQQHGKGGRQVWAEHVHADSSNQVAF